MRKDYSCLEQYVGLRGICEDVEGALYVNDLPGVDAKVFSNSANVEDLTGKEMFTRLRREAARRVAKHFLVKLNDKYQVEEVAERMTIGAIDEDRLTGSKTYKIENVHPQTSLHLEMIKIFVDQDGSVDITVNEETTSHEVTKGYNTFLREDEGNILEITVAGVDGLQIAYSYRSGCGTCAYGSGTLPGILTFAVRCDQIICLFAEDLADATRYMTAALLMEEVEYSDRTNPLVRNKKESAGRIRARILGGEDPVTEIKNSSLYWQEIGQVVKRARVTGPCVTCSGLTYVESTP